MGCIKLNHLRQQRGASLGEVMIAVGILGVVATAGISIANVSGKLQTSINDVTANEILEETIRTSLENSDLCLGAMGKSILNTTPTALTGNLWKSSPGADRPGAEITMKIPFLGAGPNADSDIFTSSTVNNANYLTALNLKIDRFYIKNAELITNKPNTDEYVGQIFLQTSRIEGRDRIARAPRLVSGLIFEVDDTDNYITSCRNSFSKTTEEFCKSIDDSCVYNPLADGEAPCTCDQPILGCGGPDLYPVDIVNGIYRCKKLGGARCPLGEYLVSIGLGRVVCMKTAGMAIRFLTASSTVIEGAAATALKVIASEPQLTSVIVPITVTNGGATYGTDYTTNPAVSAGKVTITIPANANSATFTFTALVDAPADGGETVNFAIDVPGVISARTMAGGTPLSHMVTIQGPNCTHSATYTWSGCSGTGATTIAEGASLTISDSAHPFTGNATFTCTGGSIGAPTGVSCAARTCNCDTGAGAVWREPMTPITWTNPVIGHNQICGEQAMAANTVGQAYKCNDGTLVDFGDETGRNNTGDACYGTAITWANFIAGAVIGGRTFSLVNYAYRVYNCP